MFTLSGLLLFHNVQSKCSKNNVKEGTECEVVELYHAYETNDDTDFEIETVDNFPLPFNEFYNISQDSFQDVVHNTLLTFHKLMKKSNILNVLSGINILFCGDSIEVKNSQHLICTLQLLKK